MRDGLRAVLDADPTVSVVAEAGDVPSAVRMVRAHRPDVLVLDLNMPGEASLPAIPGLLESSPDTKIVVLTMQADPGFAEAALQSGASGYVVKEAASEELVKAIRIALDGGTYLQPELGALIAADRGRPRAEDRDGLSDREREVLRLVALGHTNPEIATQLFLSVRTVESHRAHIHQKLRVSTRAELVRYAIDNGLLDD
jgi:two-component system response regulator NreC